jgi:hypothetical protein
MRSPISPSYFTWKIVASTAFDAYEVAPLLPFILIFRFRIEEAYLKFEYNDNELTPEEREEIQDFLQRVEELGAENAFFDEEALVFIDGTHVPIPEKIRVIRD